jgi:hypothetical protein
MIPEFLKPKKLYSLKRLGKNNDGGYLVGINSIFSSDVLIAFGIHDDCSFERYFKKQKNIPVFAYDAWTDYLFWCKKFCKGFVFLFFFNFKYILTTFLNFINFKLFFTQKNNYFFKNKIGKGGYKVHKFKSFDEIINKDLMLSFLADYKKKPLIFFKIDIEGSEYRIFDDLIKIRDQISGIVIECHDVDLHLEKIKIFINNIGLTLIHVHANNTAEVDKSNVPTLLELTFERNPIALNDEVTFPHYLDQKNNSNLDLTELKFK